MPSANDFATRALQSIGVVGAIDTIASEDAALALNVLNEWIDQLGIQRNTIYTVKRQTHTLASGTSSYTIGSGGTINVARPIWIENVGLILDTGSSTPVEAPRQLFTDDEYAGIAEKTLQSGLIQGIWFDHEWASGLGNIHVWPVPNVATTQLVLYLPTPLTEFADLSTAYTFPPGYERAIRSNLAVELAPFYGIPVSPDLRQQASSSMLRIKRANVRIREVPIDPSLTRRSRTMTNSQFRGGLF